MTRVIRALSAISLAGAIGIFGCNGVASPDRVIEGAILAVHDVNANSESFVGKPIRVRGRIVVDEAKSARPCHVVTGEGCNQATRATLYLVDPQDLDATTNRLNLYRRTSQGTYVPVECGILKEGTYDCGSYTPGSIMVVDGTFAKQAEPAQQVIYPDGSVAVLQYRDVYFLVIP